jgi:phosphoserine aminotransferase
MADRVFNFSPGPAVLPLKVLQEAQRDLLALPGLGISALEISHRSQWFDAVLEETTANLRKLLGLGGKLADAFSILYMQGGSRLQFSTIPMNFLGGAGQPADYLITGSWSKTALVEARREGEVRVVFDNKDENYRRLPRPDELKLNPDAAYLYYCSNETIQGVQFPGEPGSSGVGILPAGQAGSLPHVPLVCDASSDFLCRPLDMARYGVLYACAQKNLGPAGITVVIVRNDMLQRVPDGLHSMLDYRVYAKEDSRANTPPVFAVYMVMLVTRWLLNDIGGLAKMEALNRQKSQMLYELLDKYPDLYQGHAERDCRSLMNVTFRLPSEEATNQFVKEATARRLCELKGHRSVGGIRASIYNAMPVEGVEALRDFMVEFAKRGKA